MMLSGKKFLISNSLSAWIVKQEYRSLFPHSHIPNHIQVFWPPNCLLCTYPKAASLGLRTVAVIHIGSPLAIFQEARRSDKITWRLLCSSLPRWWPSNRHDDRLNHLLSAMHWISKNYPVFMTYAHWSTCMAELCWIPWRGCKDCCWSVWLSRSSLSVLRSEAQVTELFIRARSQLLYPYYLFHSLQFRN